MLHWLNTLQLQGIEPVVHLFYNCSFSKFSLQLLAVGAPPELVERAHSSALDEIRHAQLSFGLASAYSSSLLSPGEYKEHSLSIKPNLLEMCEDTAKEGCVVETFSTLSAASKASKEIDPVVKKVLETIIKDE